MLSFIWAEDANGLIGAAGQLPWRLPDDMHYFKRTTMGNTIISGSRTFRSYNKPLPGRTNIVISSHSDFPDGVQVISSIEKLCDLVDQNPDKQYIVTGGANLFSQLLSRVDRLYRTKIAHEFSGDTFMPKIDYSLFKQVKSVPGVVDEKNKYPHTFEVFDRK
ncbi:dihydrofolate reductase [Lentilactobacillus kefiri]|uniref:Dihydrofolate reductase n=1 Tax=Lentilactobacillus kefiri TaxID=33962 RepID=A0A511DW17_LENKE|nr:dihydrofolate reductase [Lentilactobacillus kefiri]KRL62737.1 dihydrofolate reductase subunit [Lentilactobacillus parakefiri DSM 10551]MCJ2160690.1 dihydrofolate reductase [Lentilactobacillus kefiri]MCP9367945.1 dihydrofolate reductase [Lentilactobacillus kefiri]MDH5107505.1 dihydrofolate reductase [Lentilactobacillus kefiri]MDM7491882.1 dihydrofolate reductase [Lentilactobacillus kefiri]